jgi:Fic family protein
MVYLKRKTINGSDYWYWTKSIRLPDGAVKTIQRLARKGDVAESNRPWFTEREKELAGDWSVKKYKTSPVFTEEQIRKVEGMRIDYRHIVRKLTRNQLKDVFDRFTVNFTYESNALEGSSLTLKDVAMVLFEKNIIKGKDLREIYETVNSREVVDSILRRKFKVREKDIIKMHEMLVQKMEIETGYKKIPNFIPGRVLETVPPEKVEKEVKKLLHYYEENKDKMHPLQLAAHFHGRFEKIHPFDDGNGRVGRFLVNVMLINDHYPPLIIRKTQRIHYLKCLEDYDRGYGENLERFLLEKYKDTYHKFFETYVKYV